MVTSFKSAGERAPRYALLRLLPEGVGARQQPKFLSMVEGSGQVIVKFARHGSRMAEPLPLEHLALTALADVGLPAAATQLLASDDFVFLEVQRFDRVGAVHLRDGRPSHRRDGGFQ